MILKTISKTLLLTAILLATASIGTSQKNTNPLPLKSQLKLLESSHTISFIYENGLLDGLEVNVDHDPSTPLEQEIKNLFKDFKLEAKKISHNTYAIIRRIDTIVIYGKVTDERGSPLVGATVSIDQQKKGTTTDINGDYELVVLEGSLAIDQKVFLWL